MLRPCFVLKEPALKIVVCIKQVPARDAPLRIAETGVWIREADISFETNEPDSYALSNSFGFGGTNAALLFKRWEDQ